MTIVSENTRRLYGQDNNEEEMLLQLAIRQSLASSDTPGPGPADTADQVDIWEALEGLPPGHSRAALQGEDRLLQQAIEVTHCTYARGPYLLFWTKCFQCIYFYLAKLYTLYCRPA